MMHPSSDYHRPFQGNIGGFKTDKIGRSLLDLLRSRDKLIASDAKHDGNADNGDSSSSSSHQSSSVSEMDHELITKLNSLQASIRRCGLFATAERAQAFYTCASERSSSASAAAACADRTTEDAPSTSGGGLVVSSSKKRKRKNKGGTGGGNNNASSSGGGSSGLSAASYGIHLDSHTNTNNNNNAASFAGVSSAGNGSGDGGQKELLDEGLILTSICRILGVTVGRKKKKDAAGNNDQISSSSVSAAAVANSCHSFGLKCAALNVILAICTHAKDGMIAGGNNNNNNKTTTCASIESEMIGSIGSPLLDALVDNILYFYYKNDCQDNNEARSGENTLLKGLIGCFKSCAAVVSLLEMNLSRADKTLTSLKDATWFVLNNLIGLEGSKRAQEDDVLGVQRAAIVVLSTLPLVGDSDGTPPSKVWSQTVINGMTLLRWAVQEFFPMPSVDGKGKSSDSLKGEAREHPNLWKEHETWLSIAKEVPSESAGELDLGNDPTDDHRSKALQSRISCLTSCIHSLLQMEGYPLHRSNTSLSSTILLPLDALVDVSEILLSFPLAAEAKHRTTKSRLRSSPVKDGLISPNAALEIAPSLRLCGHTLLNVTMESCRGGSGALSRARRLVGIVVANLQSSCSSALVSVVDGRRGVLGSRGVDSKGSRNMGWLRDSIPLRIKSIQTFHSVIMSLGSGVMSSSGTSKSTSRALVLLGGSLLEQVTTAGDGVGVGDEWGTLGERAKLVEITSNALASCLAAFGGLIPNHIRGTIDSIIETSLSKLFSCGGSSIFAYSFVKQSIIRLGMNCVCVSWGDGGRSNITEIVRTTCSMLRNDSDLDVVSAALSTLCALDAFTTPRAPPILIPTRESVSVSATTLTGFTASSLLQGIEESNTEMMLSKITADAKKSEGKKKKPNKKQKKNQVEAKAISNPSKPSASKTTPEENKLANKDIADNTISAKGSKSRGSKSIAKTEGRSDVVMDNTVASADDVAQNENGRVDTSEEVVVDETMPTIKGEDRMDTTSVDEEEEEEQDAKSRSGNDSEEDENSSLDDFPDIVDEDPDEEDQ